MLTFVQICSRCPSLHYFNAPVCGDQDTNLAHAVTGTIAMRWRNLRRLNLFEGTTDEGLVAMISKCGNLQNLNCPYMYGKDMMALALNCPHLAHITIDQEFTGGGNSKR